MLKTNEDIAPQIPRILQTFSWRGATARATTIQTSVKGRLYGEISFALFALSTFKLGKVPLFKALFPGRCCWIFAHCSLTKVENKNHARVYYAGHQERLRDAKGSIECVPINGVSLSDILNLRFKIFLKGRI